MWFRNWTARLRFIWRSDEYQLHYTLIPPDLTDHLSEFINFAWTNSGNNVAGTYNIDYWVDDVEFF